MTDLLSNKIQAENGEIDATFDDEVESPPADTTALETAIKILRSDDNKRSTWVGQALCGGKTHLFFAPPGERRTRRTKREALAMSYCLQCPVVEECRQWARENRESGFWGGENEEQRAAAGFAPRSPNRRAVADAARNARKSA